MPLKNVTIFSPFSAKSGSTCLNGIATLPNDQPPSVRRNVHVKCLLLSTSPQLRVTSSEIICVAPIDLLRRALDHRAALLKSRICSKRTFIGRRRFEWIYFNFLFNSVIYFFLWLYQMEMLRRKPLKTYCTTLKSNIFFALLWRSMTDFVDNHRVLRKVRQNGIKNAVIQSVAVNNWHENHQKLTVRLELNLCSFPTPNVWWFAALSVIYANGSARTITSPWTRAHSFRASTTAAAGTDAAQSLGKFGWVPSPVSNCSMIRFAFSTLSTSRKCARASAKCLETNNKGMEGK